MPPLRLQKIIAQAGLCSRRRAEELIAAGRVAVDGVVVRTLGAQADPLTQAVTVDGKPLARPASHQYWLLHKPYGVVSTVRDPQGRPGVLSLLPPEATGRLYPVGRLDRDSEGLILLTNDGDLAARLTHPRHHVPKTYRVWVEGVPSREAIERLRSGVTLEDGPTSSARVYLKGVSGQKSKLSIVLTEGRKRQIRRMCEAVGHPVLSLVRVALGPLHLGDLPRGAARRLSLAEVAELRRATDAISGCKPEGDKVKNPGDAALQPRPAPRRAAGQRRPGQPRRETTGR